MNINVKFKKMDEKSKKVKNYIVNEMCIVLDIYDSNLDDILKSDMKLNDK